MQITSAQSLSRLLSGIQRQLDNQLQGNEQVASGKRFLRPSDAPSDFQKSISLRRALSSLQTGQQSIETGKARLQASMGVVGQMQSVLNRAQVVATQMANATVSVSERNAAAVEMENLKQALLNLANTTWQGDALFAGTATKTPAFILDVNGHAVYQGSIQDRAVDISSTIRLTSNVRGDEAAFSLAFSALENLQTALQNNNVIAIQAGIDETTQAASSMADMNAKLGAMHNVFEIHLSVSQNSELMLQQRLDNHEQANLPEVITRLEQSSVTLQALYSQISRFQKLSLVNFL
ncbi:MAG: hypothetical protein ACE5DY_09300 [Mariprofundaceae bacterium]